MGLVGVSDQGVAAVDVEGWSAVPVWRDASKCVVAIDSPPLHGSTFGDAAISEAGRRLLAERLGQLSEKQIRDLFEGSRFADYADASAASKDVGRWVKAFQAKVRMVVERPPCPAL